MNPLNKQRRVVCAANRYKDILLLGPRHWDQTMHTQRALMRLDDVPSQEFEQGFVNTWGEFLTREEAWEVAMENSQVLRFVGGQAAGDNNLKLYSENLY